MDGHSIGWGVPPLINSTREATHEGGIMKKYDKPVLEKLSMATQESMTAFDEAFNSPLEGLDDTFINSYDMSSMFNNLGGNE